MKNAVVGCVDKESQGIPPFIINTIDNLINYICGGKGKYFFGKDNN